MLLETPDVGLADVGDRLLDDEWQRDLSFAYAHDNRDSVVSEEQIDLFAIIAAEEIRAC